MLVTESLGYDAFVVDETCGFNLDCRNALFLPRARAHLRFAHA